MNNALLLLNRPEKGWVLIYPDETKDRFLRSLPLPGPFHKREITARAIASLNAVHPETGEAFGQFDIDSRLETFFPGDMPRLSEDFGGFETFLKVIRPKLSKIEPYIREISKYPLLTVPQERGDDIDLNKTAPDGSGLSYWRWRLIVHNLRLVVYIALKFSAKGMQLEDLIQEGTLGLFRATETFDPHKGNRFSTYACYWIQQRVYRSLYRNSNLIRWPSYKAAELVKANRSGRREELKLGERFVKSATEEWEEIESIPDPDDWGLNKAIRDDIKDEVLKAVNDFPEREAKIMKCRWALGGYKKKTLAELSIVFGISRERVRQIENECKKKLTYSLRHLVNQRIFLQKVKQFK
jgi:RNA polymerase primary sigma factor